MSVTDPVTIHLKDICHWEGRIIEPMLNLHYGAEFLELVVEEGGAVVGNIASSDILLRSTEITHEVISIGRRNSVYETADCVRRYFNQKKERRLLSGK